MFDNIIQNPSYCPSAISSQYQIIDTQGCRGGLRVVKREWYDVSSNSLIAYAYSDGIANGVGWALGDCQTAFEYDFEPVCITNDGGVSKISGVARWEVTNGSALQKLYNGSGVDVTSTYQIIDCGGSEKFDISDKLWFCLGGVDISRLDVLDVSSNTPTIVSSIWQNIQGNVITTPAVGTYSIGQCYTPTKKLIAAIPGCLINGNITTDVQIEKYDTGGVVSEEIWIPDFRTSPITRSQYIASAGDNVQIGFCSLIKTVELGFESGCIKRTITNPIPLRANKQCDSYASFMANYDAWTNPKTYDNLYSIPGGPRNHYYRIKLFDGAGLMLSDAILGPYAVDTTNNTYLRFLSDLSAITAPVSVSFPGMGNIGTGYQIQYNDTVFFGITLEHGYDNHSGGIQWNAGTKQAISYQPGFSSVVDSINGGGDFNNAYSAGRDYATVNQPTNCISI